MAGEFDDLPNANAFADLPSSPQTAVLNAVQSNTWRHLPDALMGALQSVGAIGQMVAHQPGANEGGILPPLVSKLTGGMTVSQAADAGNQIMLDAYNKWFPNPTNSVAPAFARGVGQGLATAPLVPTLGPSGVLANAAKGAVAGSAGGALTPVYGDTSDFWQQKLGQLEQGAKWGAAFGGGGTVLGKLLSPAVSGATQLLQSEGVTPPPGAALGGLAKSIEDKLSSLIPFIGPRQADSISQMNRAMYARATSPFGDEGAQVASNATVGYKGVEQVGDFLSSKYDQGLAASQPIQLRPAPAGAVAAGPVDTTFQGVVDNLAQMLPSAKQQDFLNLVNNNVFGKLTPGGTLTPSVAKDADSAFGQMARTYRTGSGDDQLYSQAIREAQSALRQSFANGNPDTAPIIRAADQGWATLVQIERAAGMVGAKDGIFSPSQLRNSILIGSGATRTQKATGNIPNLDLANAAEAVLPNKTPDSGTTARALMAMMLGEGIGHLSGSPMGTGALATAALGSIPYLPGISPIVTKALTIRPDALVSLGQLTQQGAPFLAIPGASAMSPSATR